MELEDLKKGWKEMDKHIDYLQDNNEITQKVIKERIVSVQERLARRFRLMTALCLIAPSFLSIDNWGLGDIGVWTKGGFFVFFIVMAIHKGFLWMRMSRLNFMQMTGKEALISTYKLEKIQKIGMLIGFPFAFIIIAFFMLDLYHMHEMYALYGACSGLIVGLFCGLRIRSRIKKEFQQLRSVLDDELN
ncbi:hypothetical protein [uncultured Parabacteroides sp.]|uniref:hypothetical protein n=1 Tax=uncultured Parabacteroides sp. TaxID=512312 RepID=UPI002596D8BA|nr:hypothetical protein [uncultured Parabacteroides sp.]